MGKAQGLATLSGTLTTTGTIPSTSIVGGSGGGSSTPTISAIGYGGDDTATDVAGGRTITLTGTNFAAGAKVLINLTQVSVVTVVSATQITFAAPANPAGSYVLYVVNADGSTAISVPGIQYSGVPAWTTAAGTLGTLSESTTISTSVAATSNSAVSYSVASGTLPVGASLSTAGVLTGTTPLTASSTTYNFTIRATDLENQDTDRSFSLTINPDVVTWVSANTAELFQNVASSATLSATSASGKTVSYATDTLPPGMTLTGNTVSGTPTTAGTTTTVATATAATTLKTANQTITWTVVLGGDIYWKNTTLLLSGNGTNNAQNNTFVDSSANNYTITRGGSPAQGTFSPYGPNWSVLCTRSATNASETRIQVSSTTGLGLASNNFCIEMWVYFTSSYTGDSPFCTNIISGFTTNTWWFGPHIVNSGRVTVYNYNYSSSAPFMSESTSPPINQWTHYALVRNGNAFTIYRNGTSSATATFAGAFAGSSSGLMISKAGDNSSGGGSFDGYLSNLRVVNGSSVYTSNFTPPTAPLTAITNTGLLTLQSNRFIDNSIYAASVTINQGTPTIQRLSPFSLTDPYSTSTIGGSVCFDGVGDYITIPYTGDPTGNFTIEFWWYPLSFAPNYQEIFTKGIGIQIFAAFGSMTAAFAINGGSYYLNAGFGAATLNSWNHIAVVKNNTTYTGYVNGVGTVIGTSSSVPGTQSNPVSIGYYAPGPGYYTNGYVSDARYVTNTAVYTANFTPPTAPLTAIANTQLLCKFANAGIIDSTMQNNIETVGSAKISTTQSKFGGSSISLAGGGPSISMQSSVNFGYGTGDFTIECWAYITAVGLQTIWSNLSVGVSAAPHLYTLANGTLMYYQSGADRITGLVLNANTWYHIAVCRASGSTKLFVNGTQSGSTYSDSTNYGTSNPMVVGDYGTTLTGTSTLTGYIDDLRVTKGFARYTGNFTPPTAALPTK